MSAAGRRSAGLRAPRALALAGFLLLAAGGCGGAVSVTVVNRSAATLDSLLLIGGQDRVPVRALAPGESARVAFPGRGEDALALRGRCGALRLASGTGVYVEPGYRVRAVVDSNGNVIVQERAGAY